jgi:acetate kinase
MSADEVDHFLNKQSGLAGLSGLGKDLRDIEKAADEGHDRARLAIAAFAHRVRKYIGAYAATLGGVDAIVLTGGIGENSATMRRRILQRLEFMGVRFAEGANQGAELSSEQPVAEIHAPTSRVKVLAIKTNEELQIAKQTAKVVAGSKQVKTPQPIPVAISARHVHLDRKTMDTLFGAGTELTPYRDLSQPGQFACEQKVDLIGPRSRIDGVRVLGPLRGSTQVEISRTDEFRLGVDAPVRGSGNTKGSAPITIEGPKGTVHLEEGLICAWRHIHMTPADAAAYGVEDGDMVEVAIDSAGRDLIFGDVMVRVSPKYKLEMHIDTDEANAAELSRHAKGELVYSSVEGQAAGLLRKR